MTEKMFLVTFAISEVVEETLSDEKTLSRHLISYGECVTPSPVGSLLATRDEEVKRQAKICRHPQHSLTPREYHIVNVVELTKEQANVLSPPKPTLAEMKAMFEEFRPVKPDVVVEDLANGDAR
jgi:hypothetical protein